MNKIEEMLSENHGLHTSYSVKNKDGEFESVVSVKSAAEITEQIAIEFSEWQQRLLFSESSDWLIDKTTKELFQLFLKTKQ